MSGDRAGNHAKRRCEDSHRSPRKPAARARSDICGRSARGEIMLERRARGEPLHDHEPDGGGDPLRKKSRDRRRRPDIGAGCGGACPYAAKSVMVDRISARNSRPGSIQSTRKAANFARRGEPRGRRGCGEEEGLHQKRIEREHAERGALCNRPLAETPHPQSPQPMPLSRSRSSKHNGRSERIRTSGPLVPNEVRYQAALHSGAPPNLVSGRTLLRCPYSGAWARPQAPRGTVSIAN